MKKIKNYKINIRQREVLRLLKATAQITDVTPQLEETVLRESQRVRPLLRPAAVYETLPKEKLPGGIMTKPPSNLVAATVFVTTVGEAIESAVKEARASSDALSGHILHAIALEAMEQADNFIHRLINEEAKEESCELSRHERVNPAQALEVLSAIVPGDKIGVRYLEDGRFEPMYSSCGIVYWMPVKKSRR